VFCTVEALARLADTLRSDLAQFRSPTPAANWFRYSPVMGWEKRPGFKGKSDDGVNRNFDAQGFLDVDSKTAAEAPPHTVLFLGDSNTFGYGAPTDSSFAEVTPRLLPEIKTVNLGVIGYTSYQGRKTLERYISRIHPAAVVASFNFNDRRSVAEGAEDSPAHFQNIYDSSRNSIGPIDRALKYLYFYRDAGQFLRRAGPPDLRYQPADKFRPRVDEAQYRENLTAIAEKTKQAGVPLIFVLLRDNPLESGYLSRGIEALAKGAYPAALEDFNVLIRANGMQADLARIYSARVYRAMGKNREAAEVLRGGERIIYLLGGRPIRLDSDYNAIMRQVAAQYNADLVDAASVLEKDPFVFIDFVHFDSAGHRKVAELLAAALAKAMKLAPANMPGQSRP
jgi:lysophospholipase L1-like esterase